LPLNSPNDGLYRKSTHQNTLPYIPRIFTQQKHRNFPSFELNIPNSRSMISLKSGPFLQFQLNCKLYPKVPTQQGYDMHRSCPVTWLSTERLRPKLSSKVCDFSGPKMGSILMLRTMLQDVPRSFLVCELDDFFLIGSPCFLKIEHVLLSWIYRLVSFTLLFGRLLTVHHFIFINLQYGPNLLWSVKCEYSKESLLNDHHSKQHRVLDHGTHEV